MASKTPNLGLIKPARGEYENTWDVAVNKNTELLDGFIGDIQAELVDARGTKGSINERLSIGLNADGTVKDTAEVTAARNSTIYGNEDSGETFDLSDRLEKGDREVFDARAGAASLIDGNAAAIDDVVHNSVLSAPTGFLSFTGANVKVDGSVTPVVCNINGYRQVVRDLKSAAVSGASGTYYVYLDLQEAGEVYLDRSGSGQNNGAVSTDVDTGKLCKFSDPTQNFTSSGVTAGDLLEITTVGSVNRGTYVVSSVVDANTILIQGAFPSTQTNLNYKLTNPLSPSLGVTDAAHTKRWSRVSGRIYIGRAVFDGTNITSVSSYALKGRFEQFVSVTLSANAFSQTVTHGIGYLPSKMQFFASQANTYNQDLEPLSVSDMSSSTLQRSVIVKFDDMTVSVKNATNGVFYKGFDGTTYTSGYILIVAER